MNPRHLLAAGAHRVIEAPSGAGHSLVDYAQLHASNRRAFNRPVAEGSITATLTGDVDGFIQALAAINWETFIYEQRALAKWALATQVAEVERRLFGDPWDRP